MNPEDGDREDENLEQGIIQAVVEIDGRDEVRRTCIAHPVFDVSRTGLLLRASIVERHHEDRTEREDEEHGNDDHAA